MSSLETWFRSYYAPLTAFAWKLVGSQAIAEDLVQQLFVSLYEKGDQLTMPDSPKAYLYQAVRNRCLNHLKQHQRKQSQETPLEAIPDQASRYTDPLEATEFEAQLYEWIQALPAACQQVFRLSRFEAKSNAEIAELLGISKRTVETQISKALKILRNRLRMSPHKNTASLPLLWIVGASMLASAGCLDPIPFPVPAITTPRLVVESQFQPDSSWQLWLSQSQAVNDSVFRRSVSNARVLLRGPDWEEEMSETDSQYVSDRQPQEGEVYELRIFADGLGSALASDTVPYAPEITILDTLTTVVSGQRAIVVEMELIPHPQTQYHVIEASFLVEYQADSSIAYPLFLIGLDEKIDGEGLGGNGGLLPQLYLPGISWNGVPQRLRFAVDRPFFPFSFGEPDPTRASIRIEVSAASRANYAYRRGMSQYTISNGLGIISQPLEIPSNIQQGLGIFGAHSPSVAWIELK